MAPGKAAKNAVASDFNDIINAGKAMQNGMRKGTIGS